MTLHRTHAAVATALVLGPLALLAPGASAATSTGVTSGTTKVALGGAAYRTLTRADVTVRSIGAARKTGSTITLPVAKGVVGATTLLEHAATDALILQGEDRRVRLTALRIRLDRSPRVLGRVDGGSLRVLFTLDATSLTVNAKAGTAGRKRVAWRLTASAASSLRSRLGARTLRAGRFAQSTLEVRLAGGSTAPGTTPSPGTPAVPGTPATPGTPSTPGTPAPLPAPVPGATLAGTLDWGVRASFRNYIRGFAGGKVTASDGAAINGDGTYRFVPTTGTIDATTGAVSAASKGTIAFEGHGSGDAAALRLSIRNPRIEAPAGAATGTLYADVSSKSLSEGRTVEYPNVAFATLDLAGGTRRTDGTTITWTAVPAKLTAAGAEAFAGFYEPGADLDPVSLGVRRN